jgi:hypothetical protein
MRLAGAARRVVVGGDGLRVDADRVVADREAGIDAAFVQRHLVAVEVEAHQQRIGILAVEHVQAAQQAELCQPHRIDVGEARYAIVALERAPVAEQLGDVVAALAQDIGAHHAAFDEITVVVCDHLDRHRRAELHHRRRPPGYRVDRRRRGCNRRLRQRRESGPAGGDT